MKKRTQNKLRRLFYSDNRPILFTHDNITALNALVEVIRRAFGKNKKRRRH